MSSQSHLSWGPLPLSQQLRTITLDGYAASHREVREMRRDGLLPRRAKLRSSKYLNNLLEQDHRGIRFRTRPMLGFKNFESAAITITAIELLPRIHKEQFTLDRLRFNGQAAPAIRNAVLGAYRSGESIDRFHLTRSHYFYQSRLAWRQIFNRRSGSSTALILQTLYLTKLRLPLWDQASW